MNLNDPEGLAKCGDLIEVYQGMYAPLRDFLDQNYTFGLFAGVVWAESDARNIASEKIAIAESIINRWFIVNNLIWVGTPDSRYVGDFYWAPVSSLGMGSPGDLRQILARGTSTAPLSEEKLIHICSQPSRPASAKR